MPYLSSVLENLPEITKKLKSLGYTLGKQLGKPGKYGIAFEIPGNKALKITSDRVEAHNNARLKKTNLIHTVKVYRVFTFKSIPDIYISIIEKVKPLKKSEKDIIIYYETYNSFFRYLYNNFKEYAIKIDTFEPSDEEQEAVLELVRKYKNKLSDLSIGMLIKSSDLEKTKIALKNIKFFNQLTDTFEELFKNGFSHLDFHSKNVGTKNGILKIFDLGERSVAPGEGKIEKLATADFGKYLTKLSKHKRNKMYGSSPTAKAGITTIFFEKNNLFHVLKLKNNKTLTQDAFLLTYKESGGDTLKTINKLYNIAKNYNIVKWYEKNIKADRAKKLLVVKEGMVHSDFDRLFPHLDIEDKDTIVIDKFNILYYKLTSKEITRLKEIFNKFSNIVKKIGYKKLLYGEVHVRPHLPGKDMADYEKDADSIDFERKALKGDMKKVIHSLGHEIGHRLLIKFKVDVKKIKDKFEELSNIGEIKIKDIFIDPDGHKLKIIGMEKGQYYVYDYIDDQYYTAPKNYFFTCKKVGLKKNTSSWFPTEYSTTSHIEWFCELFGKAISEGNVKYLKFIKEVS